MPAFQSIHSVVQAFGSVSMMLESTYHAIHNSFQAVLSVAEHFSKMKLQVSEIFSTFTLLRSLKYILTKLLYLIGLTNKKPIVPESAWQDSFTSSKSNLTESDLKSPMRWPILLYLTLTMATPYLTWKLVKRMTTVSKNEQFDWQLKQGEHYIATAMYDFNTTREQELPLREGTELVLAPRHLQPRVRGWLLGTDGKKVGLIPANYINIIGRSEGKRVAKPDVVSSVYEESFVEMS